MKKLLITIFIILVIIFLTNNKLSFFKYINSFLIANQSITDTTYTLPGPIKVITNNELALYKGTVTLLSFVVSLIALVFGGLLAINVFSGREIIKDAKDEIDKIVKSRKHQEQLYNDLEQKSREILNKTITEIHNEDRKTLEKFLKKEYEQNTINRYKQELLEDLEKDGLPELKKIYYKLTEIINYPDKTAFKIYKLCLEKFPDDKDIIKVIVNAQELAGRKCDEIITQQNYKH